MNFINPWMLAAFGALAALPIAVHLLTRPRPVRYLSSTIRFIESALKQRRFFARLRDVLVLALRTILLAAIVFAFARPVITGRNVPSEEPVARRVVILDVSASMDAHKSGMNVFQAACAKSLEYLKNDSGLRSNLIIAGARPRAVFERFSSNFLELQSEARNASPRPEALDAKAAVAKAAQLFSEEDGAANSQLVIVTDLQETNWREITRESLPPGIEIVVEAVGLGPDAGNLAVTNVVPLGRIEAGRPARLRVDMQNYSGADQTRTVELTAADRVLRLEASLKAGAAASLIFELSEEETSLAEGWLTGQARIIEARDALEVDDSRSFAFELKPAPRYLLVSNDNVTDIGTPAHYLARMIEPYSRKSRGEIRALPADAVTPEALNDSDMVILCRPGRLRPECALALAETLTRGRPMLYLLSGTVDAENLSALARAAGHAVQLPVRYAAWEGQTGRAQSFSMDSPRQRVSLQIARPDAPLFRTFGDSAPGLAATVTGGRALQTAPEEGGVPQDVLATWSDGNAALIETVAGSGRLVLWNGDIISGGFARNGFFVALVRETAAQLLTDPDVLTGPLPCGTSRALMLPPSGDVRGEAALLTPDGPSAEPPDIRQEETGRVWRWAQVGPPGVYRLSQEGRTLAAVATACPASESNLAALEPSAFASALAPESSGNESTARVIVRNAADAETDKAEIWPWILVIALVVLLLELGLLKIFHA